MQTWPEFWKAPEKIDTGGQIGMLDPVTLKLLGQFQKTNTPDALLSANTTMRGQNMTDARAREKNSIDKAAIGKPDDKICGGPKLRPKD